MLSFAKQKENRRRQKTMKKNRKDLCEILSGLHRDKEKQNEKL